MKETTDSSRTELVRTIASDAEERGGAIVRYVSVAEGRVARLDAVPSDVLGVGASYLAKNAKTRLGGGLAVAPSTVKPGSMESLVARWKHQVDTFAAALVARWAPNLAITWKSIASHRLTPIVAFGALLALLTALALRLWQQRRWVSAMALGATVTLLAPGCDCTGKQGAGRNPRDASTLIAELPADAVFYHGDWQGSPVGTTDAAGKVTSRTAYLPYGAERSRKGLGDGASSAGAKSEPWSYVGNERDFGSGLSNFHARSYRPELGRFLSVDPVALFQGEEVLKEPMRLEAYTYAGGEPVGRSDRDGRRLVFDSRLTSSERQILFDNAQKLSDDRLQVSVGSDGLAEIVVGERGTGQKGVGSGLLRTLIGRSERVTLDVVRDSESMGRWTGYSPSSRTVVLDPAPSMFSLYVKGPQGPFSESEKPPSHIALAHELIHAWHDVMGTRQDGSLVRRFSGMHGEVLEEKVHQREAETVGLVRGRRGAPTENSIRREQGLRPRVAYAPTDPPYGMEPTKEVPGGRVW